MPEDVAKYDIKPEQLTAMLDAVLLEQEMVKMRMDRDAEYMNSVKGAIAVGKAFETKKKQLEATGRKMGFQEEKRAINKVKRLQYKTKVIFATKERDFTIQQRQLRMAMRSRSVRPKGSDIYYLWINKDHYDQLKDGAFAEKK